MAANRPDTGVIGNVSPAKMRTSSAASVCSNARRPTRSSPALAGAMHNQPSAKMLMLAATGNPAAPNRMKAAAVAPISPGSTSVGAGRPDTRPAALA